MKYYLMITIFILISCRSNRNIIIESQQDQNALGELQPDFSQQDQFIRNKREELLDYRVDSAKYNLEKLDSIAYQVATYDSSYFLMNSGITCYFQEIKEEFESRSKEEKKEIVKVLFPKYFDEESKSGIDTTILDHINIKCASLSDSGRFKMRNTHPILDSLSDDEHKYVFVKINEIKHNIPMYTKMIEEQYDAIYFFGENIVSLKTEILIEESTNLRKKKKR